MIASEDFDARNGDQLLDQGVTSKDQEDLRKNSRLHLHCWHGSSPFSKFEFKTGKYDQIQPSSLVSDTSASGLVRIPSALKFAIIKSTTVSFQAMRLALESKFMTLEQLKQRLVAVKN